MVIPTAYLAPLSYFKICLSDQVEIEQTETFEKQTFRNRCIIQDTEGKRIVLTVPVKNVNHKQLTKDVEISYQQRWQHQHWIAIRSAYEQTPYFRYYADFLLPFYTQQIRWLIDLNDRLTDSIIHLLRNIPPSQSYTIEPENRKLDYTSDWQGNIWTDRHPWQKEISIIDTLFERGPETLMWNEK